MLTMRVLGLRDFFSNGHPFGAKFPPPNTQERGAKPKDTLETACL